ncbi:HTR-like protein [Halorubrum coriense DSM 10284]|uniref:HTR-like protein n=1 Tax=Halorubrum coriense DSM 10284 TaxID=1227466 RepID=M0EPR2_9EURY|nr:response regulator [Halorubrum coriense]ELZ48409.1 HTR-like protein [Halorubrum coriense DSM 10284]
MTDHTPPPTDTRADANAAPNGADATADGSVKPREAPIAVLQVEPDARSAELLEAFASRHTDRVRVRSVESAGAALDALEAGVDVGGERVAVDCVVTEQLLPDRDGLALTERLREAGGGLPVVFHTTCPGEEREAAAFGAGADAYFEKGADRGRYDAILDRIRALVDERRDRGGDAGRAAATTPASPRSEE